MRRRDANLSRRRPSTATHGPRPPRDVREARVAFVERVYLQTGSVTATATQARAELSISRATVCRYLRSLRARWAEEAADDRESIRAEHRRRLLADMSSAREQKRWSAVATFTRLLLELDGMLVEHVEVTAKRSPLDGLSVEQLEEVAKTGILPARDGGAPRLGN